MKKLTPELSAAISKNSLTLVKCWKIELISGEVKAFTSHDQDIKIAGLTYLSSPGMDSGKLEIDNSIDHKTNEILGVIDSEQIKAEDIAAGRFDNATVEMFLVDYANSDLGVIPLICGRISDIESRDSRFFAKLKSISNVVNSNIGDVYTPFCRCRFSDSKCCMNPEKYTFSGVVSSVDGSVDFFCTSPEIISKPAGYFAYGVLKFLDGQNQNILLDVQQFTSGHFTLMSEPPYGIMAGDRFEVLAGCDKKFSTCAERFDNGLNFRGEPHLPGTEYLLKSY